MDTKNKSGLDAKHRGGLPPGILRRVHNFIEAHLDEKITLACLAEAAGLSVFHFARAFKNTIGAPPRRYVQQLRIERAQEMLEATDLPICEIAIAVGFSDHSHFAKQFRRIVGTSPMAFRWSRR